MIRILCLGKIKEDYLKDLIDDYTKRISKYHKLEIIELKDANDLLKEERELLKFIDSKDYNIALDIQGKKYNSLQFASHLDNLFNNYSNITFIIGSSLGLSQNILDKCNEHISFSEFTFPHGLFRGILLEQIYRAFKINNHETYHK